jgi:hypothetical protein
MRPLLVTACRQEAFLQCDASLTSGRSPAQRGNSYAAANSGFALKTPLELIPVILQILNIPINPGFPDIARIAIEILVGKNLTNKGRKPSQKNRFYILGVRNIGYNKTVRNFLNFIFSNILIYHHNLTEILHNKILKRPNSLNSLNKIGQKRAIADNN